MMVKVRWKVKFTKPRCDIAASTVHFVYNILIHISVFLNAIYFLFVHFVLMVILTRFVFSAQAEGEVQALTRRIRLLEEDYEQTETRLQTASEKLEEASKAADESERSVQSPNTHLISLLSLYRVQLMTSVILRSIGKL